MCHSPVRVRKTRRRPLKIRTNSRTSPVKILEIRIMRSQIIFWNFSQILCSRHSSLKIQEILEDEETFSIPNLFSLHVEKIRAKVASVRLIGNPPATKNISLGSLQHFKIFLSDLCDISKYSSQIFATFQNISLGYSQLVKIFLSDILNFSKYFYRIFPTCQNISIRYSQHFLSDIWECWTRW